jgi:hypothetical protein
MSRESGLPIVWLAPADYVNLLAMSITVVGLFVAPVFGLVSPRGVGVAFGLAAMLVT